MATSAFDAVIIGSGLGGLTAGALLSKAGYSVCLLERNYSLGGAASCYKTGSLTIEASLHETADPRDWRDLKHGILNRLDLLDKINWLPVGDLYTVQGGPVGEAFSLPHDFRRSQQALAHRFPDARRPIERVLERMEGLYSTVGRLSMARANRSLAALLGALTESYPIISGWRASLHEIFAKEFGENEGLKFALAANLPYYSADPNRLWWLFYAVAQGGFIGSGGVYVQGGSRQLSVKLGGAIKRAGGSVLLGTKVTAIELNGAGVCAVSTAAKGDRGPRRIETKTVLANCGPEAIAAMLPVQAARRFTSAFAGLAPSTSLFSAHFGLKTNPEQFGLRTYSTIHLPNWMTTLADYRYAAGVLNGDPNGRLPPFTIVNYGAIDSGLDDTGPILVTVAGLDGISNWRGLSQSEEGNRRNAWLDALLGELDRLYPGFAGAVVEKAFAGAASMERYLGTSGGSVYGFDPVPPSSPVWAGMPHSPKTPISGLYLASSYGGGGGYTGAMGAGAEAADLAATALARQ